MSATIKDIIPVRGYNRLKIHHSEFAQINSIGSEDLVVRGPAFVWSGRGVGFYHVFVDLLNDWMICKDHIPDIKLYILCPEKDSLEIMQEIQPFYYELLNMLPVEQIIYETDYKTIQFNDLYFCSNEMNFAINGKLFPDTKIGHVVGTSNPRFYEWHSMAFKNMKDFFNEYLSDKEPTLKLYISRKAEHKKIYDFYNPNSDKEKDEVFRKSMMIEEQFKERQRYRYFDPEEEDKLEQFFRDKDYAIIDFSKMSLIEQIFLSSCAKVMVGFHGAGMLNAAYMKKDSTIILLNTCNVNTFYHTELHKLDKNKVFELPDRGNIIVKQGANTSLKELSLDIANTFGLDAFVQYKAQDIIDYILNSAEVMSAF